MVPEPTMNIGSETLSAADLQRKQRPLYRYRYVYLMVLPAAIYVFVFSYVPLFGWVLAFNDYNAGMGIFKSRWVGLENFRFFFLVSSDYSYTIRNTLAINLGSIVFGVTLPMIFALLLTELPSRKFDNVMQTVSLFPYFIAWAVAYSIFYSFFAPVSGVINQVLMKIGILEKPFNLLGDSKYSWVLIWGANLWKWFGYYAVIYTASIAGIEKEMYEVAEIDGAGRFQRVWHITLPHLVGTVMILLIINSGSVFNSDLGQLMLFQNPTNRPTMEVLDMFIYRSGIRQGDFSYATAVGMVKTFISLTLLIVVNAISKRVSETSLF